MDSTLGTPLSILIEGIQVDTDGDGVWPDFKPADAKRGLIVAVAALHHGTTGGRPTVGMRIKLDDGSEVYAETTLRLFDAAARAFRARYGDDY